MVARPDWTKPPETAGNLGSFPSSGDESNRVAGEFQIEKGG